MKHWKNLLVCLLAGVLALGVLTACSGLGSVNTGTDAEKAAELAQQLGVAHTQELDNTAKAVAEWFVQEPDSLRVSGLDLVYTVALDADNNMSHTDDLNDFLYWSGCYGVPEDVTVALLLDDSTAMTAQLYAPQADSAAAELLAQKLADKGCPKVIVHDLARCDMAKAVEDAFRYGKLVLATTTYNADIFPFMKEFIHHLTERNFQGRTIGLMENGSWAPLAAKTMRKMLEGSKNLTFTDTTVKILSALNDDSKAQIESMANELCKDYLARQDETANKNNLDALFNIGYGLYVVTSSDGSKDNGLIVNTVSQVTNAPNRIAVTINKQNYSHHVIKQTGVMNVCCLDTSAPFSVFQPFGFQSGRQADKFAGWETPRSENGLVILPKYINAFMSLKVEQYVDLGTHGMFICSVAEARVINKKDTMTYTYYQENVKPKPQTEGKKGFVCTVCGYIYEGDVLPDDFICPLCKHGVADFVPIE